MADRIGQQLGNYRLTRLLGQGGFGEVYLGEHVYLKTQAAIKMRLGTHKGNAAPHRRPVPLHFGGRRPTTT